MRDRVPYTMVVFAVLMMAASYLISQLTAGQDLKIIKDLGLAAMTIFGLLIAVFIGIGLVSKEVERKSVFGLLTKPVTRAQFILGKYLGLVMTLVVNLSAMTAAFYLVLFYMDATSSMSIKAGWAAPAMDSRQLVAIVLIVAELALVTAVALLFSIVFEPPAVGAAHAWACGSRGTSTATCASSSRSSINRRWPGLRERCTTCLPNLAPFNVKAEVVYGVPVSASHVGFTLLYAAVYISALLVAAVAIFRRRDFK